MPGPVACPLLEAWRQFAGQITPDDPELRQLAESELPGLKAEREKVWDVLLDLTVGGEDAARRRCVMEIRAGTGGEEAALFARDLYVMYRRYCEGRGWKVEILSMNPTELGGFKELILGLEGEGVFATLQYESGGHRVQRVPETEAKGRIHTSAATVAVLFCLALAAAGSALVARSVTRPINECVRGALDIARASRPDESSAWFTTKRPTNSTISCQSTRPSTSRVAILLLVSRRPAAASATMSRGHGVNRNARTTTASTDRPLAVCQRLTSVSSAVYRSVSVRHLPL